ncbi:hypothetical protein RF11_09456 [Thelohanellus kitauei]|uniref:Tc1-like transposase DDE domain-containing protein n=1 Tax=Thelohanellus kitauei TaxID=669202 RepID=A0A0C2N3T8_THEKT|nr:hypothetical protein RF11_09456 [Thelohanellus kitauei]
MNYLENNSVGPCVFILDNVTFHKCDVIKQNVLTRGHQIEYLPPYSSLLNPIENMFSEWRNFVKRSNCMNEEQLLMSLNNGVREIAELDCDGWYKNMKTFIRLSLNNEDIL